VSDPFHQIVLDLLLSFCFALHCPSSDQRYIFKKFAKKFEETIGHFGSECCYFIQKLIITYVGFNEKCYFCRKLEKVAENSDHNIDPF
jgi:hypothetical protein